MHGKHQLALACFTRTHSQNRETWRMIERWTRCAAYSLSSNRRVVLQRKFQATWNDGWWLRLLISNLIHLQKCHHCCQKMRPLPCIPDRIDRCSEIKNHTFINCTLHMSPCVNANVLPHMAYEIIMSIQWPFEATCQPFSQRVAGDGFVQFWLHAWRQTLYHCYIQTFQRLLNPRPLLQRQLFVQRRFLTCFWKTQNQHVQHCFLAPSSYWSIYASNCEQSWWGCRL